MILKRTVLSTAAATSPPLPSGVYFFPISGHSQATATPVTGQLNVAPWALPVAASLTRIGGAVTTIGDVGSKVRLGIYGDDGNGRPAALLLDAGTINGDSATVQELTISLTLPPGVYWLGGVNQVVTTTAPTLRTVNNTSTPTPVPIMSTTIPTSALAAPGYTASGITGALPSTTTWSLATVAPMRLFVKTA